MVEMSALISASYSGALRFSSWSIEELSPANCMEVAASEKKDLLIGGLEIKE